MKNINIHGLTASHVEMLDVMWSMKSAQEFREWVVTLSPLQRRAARVLHDLLAVELLDIALNSDPDFTEANEVIDRFG